MEKRKEDISRMFNRIAPRYDLLNHVLSLGIDRRWRRTLVQELVNDGASYVLDMATGTADLAILAAKRGVDRVEGVDIATSMLEMGYEKLKRHGFQDRVKLLEGSAEDIPFPDGTFDAAMVAFGVRNFEDLDKGLAEMYRVIKPGGSILVLEFSLPAKPWMRALYLWYFNYILPFLGGLISGYRQAYNYLPASVQAFPQGEEFLERLFAAGFKNATDRRFTAGIASLYKGVK